MEQEKTFIDPKYVRECGMVKPSLFDLLVNRRILTAEQTWRANMLYRIGATRGGGVVFWQIDIDETVHDGHIVFFGEDAKPDPRRPSTWVSSKLKATGELSAGWQRDECLFGEHLLRDLVMQNATSRTDIRGVETRPATSQKDTEPCVAIVESERTAMLCSIFYPDQTWLATGIGVELTDDVLVRVQRLVPSARIAVFPRTDLNGNTFRLWETAGLKATVRTRRAVMVADILEKMPERFKAQRMDIADVLAEVQLKVPKGKEVKR